MRYLILFIAFVTTLTACSKKQDDSITDTRFNYINNTSYVIDINLYRKALNTISFKYTVQPHDSLALDFRSVDVAANPFGAPEVDSAEIVFDGGRRLIYTLSGERGNTLPRNIFFLSGTGYQLISRTDRSFQYRYEFTNTDYFNAK